MAAVPSIGRAARVEGALAPEADLTRALYEQYANQIFRYCLHQLGSREEAEDAVQSTFLNAFRGIKRGIVPELESAWLFKIAHNVCLSRRRTTWRRGRIESPTDFGVVEEIAPAPSRRADELIGLQDVLERMPENQRRAILLREWQGLSYREIAEELELSQAAVETLIFRARRSLANGLEQPAEPRRRAVRGADLGNVLAGLKTLLLGGGAAAKVAATVAVVSAGTVVAATPVQQQRAHAHAPKPPSAAVPAATGSAGAPGRLGALHNTPSSAAIGRAAARATLPVRQYARGASVFAPLGAGTPAAASSASAPAVDATPAPAVSEPPAPEPVAAAPQPAAPPPPAAAQPAPAQPASTPGEQKSSADTKAAGEQKGSSDAKPKSETADHKSSASTAPPVVTAPVPPAPVQAPSPVVTEGTTKVLTPAPGATPGETGSVLHRPVVPAPVAPVVVAPAPAASPPVTAPAPAPPVSPVSPAAPKQVTTPAPPESHPLIAPPAVVTLPAPPSASPSR